MLSNKLERHELLNNQYAQKFPHRYTVTMEGNLLSIFDMWGPISSVGRSEGTQDQSALGSTLSQGSWLCL